MLVIYAMSIAQLLKNRVNSVKKNHFSAYRTNSETIADTDSLPCLKRRQFVAS